VVADESHHSEGAKRARGKKTHNLSLIPVREPRNLRMVARRCALRFDFFQISYPLHDLTPQRNF
jgi:hypothetical protein